MNAATVILGMSLLGQLGFEQPGFVAGVGYEHRGVVNLDSGMWFDSSQKFGKRTVRGEALIGKQFKAFAPVAGLGMGSILGIKTGIRFVGGGEITGKRHRVSALWLSPDSVNFSQSQGVSLRHRYRFFEWRYARLWFNGTSGDVVQVFFRVPIGTKGTNGTA